MVEVIAVAAAVVVVVGILLALALKAMSATNAAADARVNSQRLEGELTIANATILTKTDEANSERKRANALDDALANAERNAVGDPSTALDRLLSQWRAARPAGTAAVGVTSEVPAPPAARSPAVADPGLLKPGE